MKKLEPKFRWHLNEAEKKTIVNMHRDGKRNVDICQELHLNRNTVHKALVVAGEHVSRRPLLPERTQQKMLRLLEKRVNQRIIGRQLKISHRQVSEFARAHGYRAKPRRAISEHESRAIVSDIVARRGSAAWIARKHGIPYKWVLELAHLYLRCERFLPTGATPLASYFPSAPPPPLSSNFHFNPRGADPSGYAKIILFIVEKCFNSELPPVADGPFVQAIMEVLRRSALQGMPAVVDEAFQGGLLSAMATLRQEPASGWTN